MGVSLDYLLHPDKHPEVLSALERQLFVGIDFGTSNTTVTMLRYEAESGRLMAEPFKIAQQRQEDGVYTQKHSHIVPTVIAYDRTGRRLLFGSGAKACLVKQPDQYREGYNVWTEFKMAVGTQQVYPHTMLSQKRQKEKKEIGSLPTIETPHDAAKLFFAFLKEQIDAVARKSGKKAAYLVTVPASFAQAQRDGLLKAIRESGIELEAYAFLDEPNAAFLGALAYLVAEKGEPQAEAFTRNENFLIFDFGAGTCDISILRLSSGLQITNLAISHFTALGGRDIDAEIARRELLPQLLKNEPEVHERTREGVLKGLAPTGEQLKCRMCEQFSQVAKPFQQAQASDCTITAGAFEIPLKELDNKRVKLGKPKLSSKAFANLMESFCAPANLLGTQAVRSIFDPIEDALRKANLEKESIDAVVLVGGSAKNPFVKERLRAYFGSRVGVLEPGDISSLVSRGAAVYSLFANGLNRPLITPILNDDIRLVAGNDDKVLLYKAGTSVPQKRKQLSGVFHPQGRSGWFKIPVYIGNDGTPLGKIHFRLPHATPDECLHLSYELTESKMLRYWLEVEGREEIQGELAYPTGTPQQDETEAFLADAYNQLEHKILYNGGKSPREETVKVAELFATHGKYATAANLLWNLYSEDSKNAASDQLLEKMADYYREAGEYHWEYDVRERLFKETESPDDLFHLLFALCRQHGNTWRNATVRAKVEEAIRLFPEDDDILRIRFFCAQANNEQEQMRQTAQKLFDYWSLRDLSKMQDFILREFRTIARLLGENSMVQQVQCELERKARSREAFAPTTDAEEVAAPRKPPEGSLLDYEATQD
ncbi:MAG: Hsp70 family protein [Kiritimatiellia bacterium]